MIQKYIDCYKKILDLIFNTNKQKKGSVWYHTTVRDVDVRILSNMINLLIVPFVKMRKECRLSLIKKILTILKINQISYQCKKN